MTTESAALVPPGAKSRPRAARVPAPGPPLPLPRRPAARDRTQPRKRRRRRGPPGGRVPALGQESRGGGDPGRKSRNCPGERRGALGNLPLRRHVIGRGGKREPESAEIPRQVGEGIGKGRDNEAEEDCACALGLADPAASGSRRLGLLGKERGWRVKVPGVNLSALRSC